ncbi:hypothetical protein KEM52_001007 [Ascosphaera acerosa]|nr:hypothetical protein KEM52_001007 [Ascosphaera acerosa]
MADVSRARARFSGPLRQGAHFADLEQTLDGVSLPPFSMNTRAELAQRILKSLDSSQILYKLDWVDADQQAKLTRPKIRASDQAMLLAQCVAEEADHPCTNCQEHIATRPREALEPARLMPSRAEAVRVCQQLLAPFGLRVAEGDGTPLPQFPCTAEERDVIMRERLRELGMEMIASEHITSASGLPAPASDYTADSPATSRLAASPGSPGPLDDAVDALYSSPAPVASAGAAPPAAAAAPSSPSVSGQPSSVAEVFSRAAPLA